MKDILSLNNVGHSSDICIIEPTQDWLGLLALTENVSRYMNYSSKRGDYHSKRSSTWTDVNQYRCV